MKLQRDAMKGWAKQWRPAVHYQRGAATILVVLLIGVGLVSASLGAMHVVRSTQERQLAAHAQVNAQAGVWATVEVVRAYLETLNKEQLDKLTLDQVWTISGNDNLAQQAIVFKRVAPVAPLVKYLISARLTATDTAARSSSSLEVVYEVKPANPAGNVSLNGVLDFYNDLNASGGITLNVPGKANFNVDGNFTADSIGISGVGLGRVAVTGDISIGSAVAADEIWARNVKIQGGATIGNVFAFGDPDGTGKGNAIKDLLKSDTCCGYVEMTGGTGIKSILANGAAHLAGSGVVSVMALRDVVVAQGGGAYTNIVSGGGINTTGASGSTFDTLSAVGNIALTEVTVSGLIKAQGNVTCTSSKRYTIKAGGTVLGCVGTIDAPLIPKPSVELMVPIEPIKLSRPVVDAWALRASANYDIELEAGKVKVAVRNINGIVNDTYYVGSMYGGHNNTESFSREYLCKSVDIVNGKSKCPVVEQLTAKPFCASNNNNHCFTFTPGTTGTPGKMKISGYSIPPGVIWFKGDIELAGTPYFNTFIATDNITTSGAMVSYALNYAAAYDKKTPPSNAVCKNEYGSATVADFLGMYPTNYCSALGVYTPNALGNIGLIAGGYSPANNPPGSATKVFSGGGITLGSSNHIYGTVIAGNILRTGGSTKIFGYISAAGLMQDPDESNELNNSTTLDLRDLPAGYNPEEIPNMDESSGGTTSIATVLWTRYL
jgi:hypothetical protein